MEGCFVAGADPELMLVNPQGELISGISLIKGTKEKPLRVKKGALQHDNVMAEFNVDPSQSSEELTHNMRVVLRELTKMVAPNRAIVRAYAEYPKKALRSRTAQVFGCDPDYTPWTDPPSRNEFDGTLAHQPYRSAGGHFHVGYKEKVREMLEDPYGKVEVCKMLDIFLGIPSILLDKDPSSPERRRLYGRAGAHRPKEYGLEYRALGNFWVAHPDYVRLMYALADRAVELTFEGHSQKLIKAIGEKRIQKTINNSDKESAKSIIHEHLLAFWPVEEMDRFSRLVDSKKYSPDLYKAWRI